MARLREFDIEDALDGVMTVFWRRGYEGASMQDIEAATGLNKQSLYRVFPDKRAMYLAALEHYERDEVAKMASVLKGAGAARERFAGLFDCAVRLAEKGDRSGCFLCNAAADQGQLDEDAAAYVGAAMRRLEKQFCEVLSVSAPYNRNKQACREKAASLLASYLGLRILVKANAPLRMIKAAAQDAVSAI